MSEMKKVTKNNLLTLVEWEKEYLDKKEKGVEDIELLSKINDFRENVINKDSSYFSKLKNCDFDSDTISYLII